MHTTRLQRLCATTVCALMIFQCSPGGVITAYAANAGMSLDPTPPAVNKDNLQKELAAKTEDYPAGGFAFYEQAATIAEGEKDREIKVVRWGDTSHAATVNVKAMDLTAEWGVDYSVYYKDGLAKVELSADVAKDEDTSVQDTPAEKQAIDEGPASESARPQGSLRSAYSQQTGKETVDTNWRGEMEEYLGPVAAVEVASHLADELPGVQTTFSFAEGEYEKTIYIHANDDKLAESEEAFKLILGSPSYGILTEGLQCNVSISDNETPEPVTFAMKQGEVVVDEGAQVAKVAIERTSGVDYYAGAVVRTKSGSATSAESYTAADGKTAAFMPGETEKTIEIPLVEGWTTGTYFDVLLDENNTNIDGMSETRIWLGKKGEALPAASSAQDQDKTLVSNPVEDEKESSKADANNAEQPETPRTNILDSELGAAREAAKAEQSEPTHESTPFANNAISSDKAPKAARSLVQDLSVGSLARTKEVRGTETVGKVVYDTVNQSVWTTADHEGFHGDSWAQVHIDYNQATKAKFHTNLWGKTTQWGIKYHKKKGRINITDRTIGSNQVVYHEEPDKYDVYYEKDLVDLSYTLSTGWWTKVGAETYGNNRNAHFRLMDVTLYYPRYTVELKDATKAIKRRVYTSKTAYTEEDYKPLTGNASWTSKTVARGESIELNPGTLNQGLTIKEYEIYIGDDLWTTNTTGSLTYSDLTELRSDWLADHLLRGVANYTIKVVPVYEAKKALVNFNSANAATVAFSGNKAGGTGFKVGDALECTQIDKVKFTAQCPSDTEFKISGVLRSCSQMLPSTKEIAVETFVPRTEAQKRALSGEFEVNNAIENLKVQYLNPVLTYEYSPDQAGAANAKSGAVTV